MRFEIPGEVKGKARPRASFFGGRPRLYTPKGTVDYENWVKLCYKGTLFNEPMEVSITAYFAIPKSFSKKKREEALAGTIRPTRKPDSDNIAKSILDALNGIAYSDDSQVVLLKVEKVYGEPKAIVELAPWLQKPESE